MHGLINRAIQCFVRDTYGEDCWLAVARDAGIDPPRFEAMLTYDDMLTDNVLAALGAALSKPQEEVLEDIGTYLVSHPNTEAVRRLLRFGGTTFEEFLQSLEDLPDRARMAVPDLELPQLALQDCERDLFCLTCKANHPGFARALLGILRTMADDYGALVYLEIQDKGRGCDLIRISLVEGAFAEGRSFELGVGL